MLKLMKQETTSKIIEDLNGMWRAGGLPKELKTVKIVAIPKANMKDDELSARPVSLLPTLTKMLNGAVLEGLLRHLDDLEVIPKTSFGFRRGVSTETCLTYVMNTVAENLRSRKAVAMVFFDFSKAFNSVDPGLLKNMLDDAGVPREFGEYIYAFLCNRRTIVDTKEGVFERVISKGVPQGDTMAPTLFNVYTASFHEVNDENGTTVAQYADDFAFVVAGKDVNELKDRLERALRRFNDTAEILGLKINYDKTKYMVFNKRADLNLAVNGRRIEMVRSYKYLGIQLDWQMKFTQHAEGVRRKLIDRYNILRTIAGIHNGAHPTVMLRVYSALMDSVLRYGASVWTKISKSTMEKMNVINRRCI
jgi:hypothetical protein